MKVQSPPDERVARLSRMRALATGLLIAMTVLFVAASLAASHWRAAAYVRAFAEAAMVGACADWFAVTALFRRPLGLPIPHTAIIARNKDRIGEALGRFMVTNFLGPRVLDAKLRELEVVAWGGAWLQRPANAAMLARRIVAVAPELIRSLPSGALEELAGSATLAAASTVPAAPLASTLLAAIWNDGRLQPLVARLAEILGAYLAEHQDVVLANVQGQSWKWLPGWVDRAIARKLTGGAVQLLRDVQQPEHPWRIKLGEAVEALIARLADDPDLRRQGEMLKRQLLADPRLREHAHRLWSEVEHQLQAEWRGTQALEAKLARLVQDLGDWLQHDPVVQHTLNTSARALVRQGVAPRREEIGRFIAQVVASWDTRSLTQRLELQVGPDLQFIRINGTLVGGLVGLALFTLSRLFGLSAN